MATVKPVDFTRIEDEPLKLPIRDVVTELCDVLGRRTVAYLAGLKSVREVSSWLTGAAMRADREAVLRSTLQAVRYISDLESRESASAWFVGTNRAFGFESPAWVLRERGMDGRVEIVRAARAFVGEALEAAESARVLVTA